MLSSLTSSLVERLSLLSYLVTLVTFNPCTSLGISSVWTAPAHSLSLSPSIVISSSSTCLTTLSDSRVESSLASHSYQIRHSKLYYYQTMLCPPLLVVRSVWASREIIISSLSILMGTPLEKREQRCSCNFHTSVATESNYLHRSKSFPLDLFLSL
jgi:hypothetical protein